MKNILDIEQQMYALELQKAKIKKEEKYNKLLNEQDDILKKKCQDQLHHNNLVIKKYNELVEEGCGKYISLRRKMEVLSMGRSSYFGRDEIKPEDYKEIDFQIVYIHFNGIKYGNIMIDDFGKILLPFYFTSRRQYVSVKTASKKIKDYFNEIEDDLKIAKNLSLNTKKIINQFQQKYPTSIIKSHIYSKSQGYNISIINIEFDNGNWVKLKVYSDGSWCIEEKHEAILKELTKEEIIDRLAPQ